MTTIKSTRTPLWSRLAQTLAGDILSGRLPVGSLLPTEAQLMNDYGMSRHTVRSALAELVHLGLIRRSPRRGTIVTGDGRGAEFTASLVPSLPADAGGRTLLSIRRMICDEDTAARTALRFSPRSSRSPCSRRDPTVVPSPAPSSGCATPQGTSSHTSRRRARAPSLRFSRSMRACAAAPCTRAPKPPHSTRRARSSSACPRALPHSS